MGAHLSNAFLMGADLSGAELIGTDLSNAYLLNANLSGADLRGSRLTQEQLDEACGDADTKPPEGLKPPKKPCPPPRVP
jgi:uncharacterized protein YjbI with pentapeptide repeats